MKVYLVWELQYQQDCWVAKIFSEESKASAYVEAMLADGSNECSYWYEEREVEMN